MKNNDDNNNNMEKVTSLFYERKKKLLIDYRISNDLVFILDGYYEVILDWCEEDYQGSGVVIYKSLVVGLPEIILARYYFGSCSGCDPWMSLCERLDRYDIKDEIREEALEYIKDEIREEALEYIKELFIKDAVIFNTLNELFEYVKNDYVHPELMNCITELCNDVV